MELERKKCIARKEHKRVGGRLNFGLGKHIFYRLCKCLIYFLLVFISANIEPTPGPTEPSYYYTDEPTYTYDTYTSNEDPYFSGKPKKAHKAKKALHPHAKKGIAKSEQKKRKWGGVFFGNPKNLLKKKHLA